ncbi:protein of unknown function [uncultured Sphingopyxis sp.]|uniref:Uncharacterized protein n=1 Tax=uncultured Sphingopyxis sp. TaxID=310581 RepID=A0A1Y5PW12_9SPHN|nr:protein of unknown function [uncultured Sphingopyxis sp.]
MAPTPDPSPEGQGLNRFKLNRRDANRKGRQRWP